MFGTSGIRGEVGVEITADLALDVGRALGSMAHDHVVVGRDPRESGLVLADAVSAGARECGASVTRLGLAGTPTIARSIDWLDADVGVSVTASHNPPTDNGLKLWTPSGRAFDESQRRTVRQRVIAEQFAFAGWDGTGEESTWAGASARHAQHLVEAFPDLDGLTTAVDLGNGAGEVTVRALEALGCDVVTLNAQPNGTFPGRPSEPTADNCADLRALVTSTDADIGIAHDGDADRMRAVTETGEFLLGDELLALFAREYVEPGTAVAAPVDTSIAVDEIVSERGGEIVRTRVGDVFVASAASSEGVVFGGEPSGTWIWPSETLCPDASYAACQLAALVADRGPLSTLVADIETYPLRRTALEVGDKAEAMRGIGRRIRERYGVVDTTDGFRVDLEDGWFLVRPSGTEPLVRVTVECRSEAAVSRRLEEVTGLVSDVTEATVQRTVED